jgi:hypothetical protein
MYLKGVTVSIGNAKLAVVTAAAAISAFQRANSFITIYTSNYGNDEVTFKASTDGGQDFWK